MESNLGGMESNLGGVESNLGGVEYHVILCGVLCHVESCYVELSLGCVECCVVVWVCGGVIWCAVLFMRICTQTATNYVDREIKSIAKVLALLYELCCFKFYATTLRTPQQLCQVIPGKMTAK